MKKLIFLRGVSGSGKSTFAYFLEKGEKRRAVAADDYFMKGGKYDFNEEDLGKAHKWCLEETRLILQSGVTAIVHNTSTSNYEVEMYKEVAEECGAEFISLIVEKRHSNENVHGVASERVVNQGLRLLNNIKVCEGLSYQATKTKPKDPSKLEVVEYLRNYPDLNDGLDCLFRDYMINSHELNGKIMLKYHQQADKSPSIVRECRGLILSKKDLEVVSIPFAKFGNYLESYADNDIDFSQAKVIEKLDGSCLCLYFDQVNKKWAVHTLGQVEAEQTMSNWSETEEYGFTWADLFWRVFDSYADRKLVNELDKSFTYIFELCTPYNRVVVPHSTSKLYFLGMRSKKTLLEAWPSYCPTLYEVFDKPKVYDFTDAKTIRQVCRELPKDDEGFVVIQDMGTGVFKKVKIKSEAYVQEHYSATIVTIKSLCNVVFANEQEEYLSIFPEYSKMVKTVEEEIERVGKEIEELYVLYKDKEAAEIFDAIKDTKRGYQRYLNSFIFPLKNGKVRNGREALLDHNTVEKRKHIVDLFLQNSKVKELINFNENTGSLK